MRLGCLSLYIAGLVLLVSAAPGIGEGLSAIGQGAGDALRAIGFGAGAALVLCSLALVLILRPQPARAVLLFVDERSYEPEPLVLRQGYDADAEFREVV